MGLCTVGLYLLEGAVGLPFFANQSGGYEILVGPTSGYLFGFFLAVLITVMERIFEVNQFLGDFR
jgi:biotin transport system substrate-specific component